jgi:DNA-binding transcriptional ArsR family regulator
MNVTPGFATIAGLVSEPSRAAMMAVLMDGRAYSATELSIEANVAPSTASSHLARLAASGLLTMVKQGRHRYYRIASPEIASVLEGLMGLATPPGPQVARPGPTDDGLRYARICYDHLAGEIAVAFLARLQDLDYIHGNSSELSLTGPGEKWFTGIGLNPAACERPRRRLCRGCLDWSERQMHLAGSLGAALFDLLVKKRMARIDRGDRRVRLTAGGLRLLRLVN